MNVKRASKSQYYLVGVVDGKKKDELIATLKVLSVKNDIDLYHRENVFRLSASTTPPGVPPTKSEIRFRLEKDGKDLVNMLTLFGEFQQMPSMPATEKRCQVDDAKGPDLVGFPQNAHRSRG